MKKKFRTDVANKSFDEIDYKTLKLDISILIKFLDDSKKLGATSIEIEVETGYDNDIDGIEFRSYYETEETDQQYASRIEQETSTKEERDRRNRLEQEKQELALYNKLKKKFEK